jgi:hypothetical protein
MAKSTKLTDNYQLTSATEELPWHPNHCPHPSMSADIETAVGWEVGGR